MAAHNRGDEDARPVEAAGRDIYDGRAAIDLGSEPEKARLLIAEAMMIRRRGRKGDQITEFLIAGPPPFESPDAWPVDKLDAFAHDSADWLRAILPDRVPLHTVAHHVDERSPHIQGCFPNVTFDDGSDAPRLSWERVLDHMTRTAADRLAAAGEPAPEQYSHRERMSILQDSFHAEVGRRYGLDRGEKGSTRRNDPPDRTRGLKERLSDTERIVRETTHRAESEAAARTAAEAKSKKAREKDRKQADALAETRAAAEQRADRAEQRARSEAELRATAEQRTKSEAAGRAAAEQRADKAEQRTKSEAAGRAAAEQRADKAEQRTKSEAAGRAAAEQRADKAEQRTKSEAAGRAAAEQRADKAEQRADIDAKRRAEAERQDETRQRRDARTDRRETRRQRSPGRRASQATHVPIRTPARSRTPDPPTRPGPAGRSGPGRSSGGR